MSPVLVKICGIKTSDMATYCARSGAYYIGLVFCEQSPRYIDLNTAIHIARAAREAGAIPVGVFNASNAEHIQMVCEKTGILDVQLHGEESKQALHSLSPDLRIIYVNPENVEETASLRPDHDRILYDSASGGSGKTADWSALPSSHRIPYFLAGGLTPENVGMAIRQTKPYAVDVSSGVESSPGIKCIHRINAFIQHVNEVSHD